MYEHNRTSIQSINPLIKLVRQREQLYFQLLSFVNKNIQSSSNDLDNLAIFNKFVVLITHKHSHIKLREMQLLVTFVDKESPKQRPLDDPNSKEMIRLASRIIELLEASIAKVRNSVFDYSGRAGKQFTRFKIMLHKILKRDQFFVKDFAEYIINYCSNKYLRQFMRIERYIEKVGQGDNICLRDMYFKENSDTELSPDQKKIRIKPKVEKKMDLKIQKQHLSSSEEPEKKIFKKHLKTSIKRKQRFLNIKKLKEEDIEQTPTKQQTSNKLLKFYSMLQLNKKQFLEDYVYDKIEQQRHKQSLMSSLIERSKTINAQINSYVKRSSTFVHIPIIGASSANKSSGDERGQSMTSKLSLRTSFIISKRISSFHMQSSPNHQKNSDNDKRQVFENTIKDINPRRRSSHSNHRTQQKSKKLFIVKTPMVFENEMIPRAQAIQTQWLQAPLTTKGKERKNDNIRLKRRNNPNPLQNTFLPESFRYPL